ncbi:MAG: hypothetical protein MJ052_05135 [Sphaerochaetaceae bacterium]|nr:hypothetical protein [Sphaerochaetaceae bacterium]
MEKDGSKYNALVSPDAYIYLDETDAGEFLRDDLLEEQERYEDSLFLEDDDEIEPETPQEEDDSDAYPLSLFDDEAEEESEENCREEDRDVDKLLFSDDEDDNITVAEESAFEDLTVDPILRKIAELLPLYCPVRPYLLSLDEHSQEELVTALEHARRLSAAEKRDKMFTVPGHDFTFAVLSADSDPMKDMQRLENIGAVMVANSGTVWHAVMLKYSSDGMLHSAEYTGITRRNFTDWEWRTVLAMSEKLRKL